MGDNTESKERERAQTSPVWSYFKVCEDNAVMADCMLCGTRMSRGGSAPNRCGTTNLRRHILYTHNIHLPSAYNKRGETDQSPRKVLRKKQVKKIQVNSKKNYNHKKTNELLKKGPPVKEEKKKKGNQKKEATDCVPNQPEPVMCIKWNTYVNNMTSTLPQLLQDEQFVDVTLACEGQSLKCHKILLAACSPYLYELLSAAACKHPIIVFKDYRFWELQALVAFMYCGEVNVPQSQLPRILRVAEALQIKGLAKPAAKAESEENGYEPTSAGTEPSALNEHPRASESKRKRKPSLHNCCKNSPKGAKAKHKPVSSIKSKNKLKPQKKKTVPPPAKKPRLSPDKKYMPKKSAVKKQNRMESKPNEPTPLPLSSSLDQNCSNLPELLPNDMPDMLNDILAMKDTDGITEGISLPEAHKVGSVDGIFPLEDLEGMKMDMDGEGTEIGPFLANGLNGSDHFDLLPQINPECRLDDDDEGR